MIEYNEHVLTSLTDDALTGAGGRRMAISPDMAAVLLSIPPHYRQGVDVRADEIAYKTRYIRGHEVEEPTGIPYSAAHAQAIRELVYQGVELLPAPSEETVAAMHARWADQHPVG